MNITFSLVKWQDLKRLNEIANQPDVARFISLTPPILLKSTIAWYKHVKASGMYWWVVKLDGKVVGSVNLLHTRRSQRKRKMGHIATLGIALDSNCWGQGIGLLAIKYVERFARKKGFKRFDLEVIKANKRALSLYKKAGFKVEGELKNHVLLGKKYHSSLVMAKWIGR